MECNFASCSSECEWPMMPHDGPMISGREMAHFDSGATRTAEPLEDYEGFLSPLVIEEFGKYMAVHRVQANGETRLSDNWQRGMTKARYMRSMWRHFLQVWKLWRKERLGDGKAMLGALSALMFNVHGMMLEVLISTGAERPIIRSEEDVSQ